MRTNKSSLEQIESYNIPKSHPLYFAQGKIVSNATPSTKWTGKDERSVSFMLHNPEKNIDVEVAIPHVHNWIALSAEINCYNYADIVGRYADETHISAEKITLVGRKPERKINHMRQVERETKEVKAPDWICFL